MPVYEYLCVNGHRLEEFREMRLSSLSIQCTVCGKEAPRIPSLIRVFGDYAGYESPVSGRWIEGRRAREEDLKRHNCRPYESGEREEAVKRSIAYERQVDKRIEETVERTANELGLRS